MATWRGYRITSDFGWRTHPIRGGRSFHTGIDLVKSHKAPIKAFTAGEVLYAGTGRSGTGLGGYGVVVFIKDENGRGHLYAHLDSVDVSKGQRVSTGQTIGRQGATGQVTGSHLHYEVRKSTTPSYGWSSDRENNCFNPTDYVNGFEEKQKEKSIKELAQEVIAGKLGNGAERKKALGSKYEEVQKRVNEMLMGASSKKTSKSINQMADEIIAGKHGIGHKTRRDSLGISKSEYEKVRREVNRRF